MTDDAVIDTVRKIVANLDAQRRTGFCDEYGIIAAGTKEHCALYDAEIVRMRKEVEHLLEVYRGKGKHQLKAERDAEARRLIAGGMSYREAARRLGLKSPSGVHKAVRGRDDPGPAA